MRSLTEPSTPQVVRKPHFYTHLISAWPRVMLATVVALAITVTHMRGIFDLPEIGPIPFTTLGVAISIFLGFRSNTAYQRFWEARTLWGAHINSSRSFARQVMTLVVSDSESRRPFQEDVVMATIAYGHAFKNHLQHDDAMDGIEKLMLPDEVLWLKTQGNVPIAILHIIGRRLASARAEGWISPAATIVLEGTLENLTNIQGGCERIKNTPIPITYGILSQAITTTFCLMLPIALIHNAGWLSPVVVFIVATAFSMLNVLGDDIAQPFGHGPHDLPLEQYTATIETNLRQILSEERLEMIGVTYERPPVVHEKAIY